MYTRTVYGAVYGVVHGAVYGVAHGTVYRSYKKPYIRIGLAYGSYTFRTTVRIRSIFLREVITFEEKNYDFFCIRKKEEENVSKRDGQSHRQKNSFQSSM